MFNKKIVLCPGWAGQVMSSLTSHCTLKFAANKKSITVNMQIGLSTDNFSMIKKL